MTTIPCRAMADIPQSRDANEPRGAPLLAPLLSNRVASACIHAGDPLDPLLPDEEAALGATSGARRWDHAAGRSCARRALASLGIPATSIPVGERRAPVWPRQIVGSITHCPGYAAAVAARCDDVASLGLDAEVHAALPDRVFEHVATARERSRLRQLRRPDVAWDRVLFSAKEAVYKTWYPLARCWLGFHDAVVSFSEDGRFRARILRDEPVVSALGLETIEGRYAVNERLVVTVAVVPASGIRS